MFGLTYLFYATLLYLIHFYKWVELQILKLFYPLLKKKGIELGEKLGLIFHCSEDFNKDDLQWTPEQEEPLLKKTQFDKLVHIHVKDPKAFFVGIANRGTLAIGETFMDGVWGADNGEDVSEFVSRTLVAEYTDLYWHWWNRFLEWVELSAFNLQTKKLAFQVAEEHYNLGNDLYENMLDPWMQYSCGYWKSAATLNEAQLHKLELIAKKLDLKPGMRVLDIGCGWGTLCKYLAKNYGVECVGVTISEEGVVYGKKINEGLPVEIRLQDYRDVNEKFDRVVSVGAFEHIGYKNYRSFMKIVEKCLVDDGIFLLHTIARNHHNIPRSEPWQHKYIFPNGNLPKPTEITEATQGIFIIEDWHNFGSDYAKTLEAWRANFLKAWPTLKEKYGKGKFYRMWIYYLSLAVGLFKSRRLQLWQIVLSKKGLMREYRAAR